MAKTRTTSFRLPSSHMAFLDVLAAEAGIDRTKVLVQLLERTLRDYLGDRDAVLSVLKRDFSQREPGASRVKVQSGTPD